MKQVGAELCQAQFKVGFAKIVVKLRTYKIEITFYSSFTFPKYLPVIK